jgi:hypothetical protein
VHPDQKLRTVQLTDAAEMALMTDHPKPTWLSAENILDLGRTQFGMYAVRAMTRRLLVSIPVVHAGDPSCIVAVHALSPGFVDGWLDAWVTLIPQSGLQLANKGTTRAYISFNDMGQTTLAVARFGIGQITWVGGALTGGKLRAVIHFQGESFDWAFDSGMYQNGDLLPVRLYAGIVAVG